jgi:hypothetical protein
MLLVPFSVDHRQLRPLGLMQIDHAAARAIAERDQLAIADRAHKVEALVRSGRHRGFKLDAPRIRNVVHRKDRALLLFYVQEGGTVVSSACTSGPVHRRSR